MTKPLISLRVYTFGSSEVAHTIVDLPGGARYGSSALEALLSGNDIRYIQPGSRAGETVVPFHAVTVVEIARTSVEVPDVPDALCAED